MPLCGNALEFGSGWRRPVDRSVGWSLTIAIPPPPRVAIAEPLDRLVHQMQAKRNHQ
jgi:hypothetical protein